MIAKPSSDRLLAKALLQSLCLVCLLRAPQGIEEGAMLRNHLQHALQSTIRMLACARTFVAQNLGELGGGAQAIVSYKWNQFALKLLYVQLAMFAVWLLSFTVFTKLFQVTRQARCASCIAAMASSSEACGSPGKHQSTCVVVIMRVGVGTGLRGLPQGFCGHVQRMLTAHKCGVKRRKCVAHAQDEDESLSLGELLDTESGCWTVALETVATVFMLPFMYIGTHLTSVYFLEWSTCAEALAAKSPTPVPCCRVPHLL